MSCPTPPDDELQDHDRQGLHVQHPRLVHLYAGPHPGLGGGERRTGRHGEAEAAAAKMLYDTLDNSKLFRCHGKGLAPA